MKRAMSFLCRVLVVGALCGGLWIGTSGCPAQISQEPGPSDGSASDGASESSATDATESTANEPAPTETAPPEPPADSGSEPPQDGASEPVADSAEPGLEPSAEPATDAGPADQAPTDADCSPVARKQVLDVAYHKVQGVDPNLLSLDLVIPARQDGCQLVPVVVWVHGGGWSIGDKRNGIQQKAALFLGAGYGLVSINYRLTPANNTDPKLRHPVHIEDVARAFAWVKGNIQQYGGDPARIAALGHSAGAHMVALLSTDESQLKAHGLDLSTIRCTGSFDTEGYDIPGTMKDAGPSLTSTYTNAFGTDPKLWAQASPITHAAKGKSIPPFLFARRGNAKRQATLASFVKALNDAGVATQVIDARTLDHAGVNNAIGKAGDTIMTPPIMAFLKACF